MSIDLAAVAGEASGDWLASIVLNGVRTAMPHIQMAGIGGSRMAEQGFEAWWPSERLAVRGYVEVLWHYRSIVNIRQQLQDRLLADPPRLFLGVDAPDFNLTLEHALKQRGVPVVHMVCPSVWAWRPERLARIAQSVDHVLCIFPFEPELLATHGIAATYIGHPLAPLIPQQADQLAARHALGLDVHRPVVALLPGSRASEIKYLAQRFLKAAQLIRQRQADVQFVLPAMPHLREGLQQLIISFKLQDHVKLIEGQSHAALAACDVTLIASGTATLEAALFKRPMVIAYNMNAISWQLMKRKKLQPWVGLPNILCQDFVVPELLQNQATPQALAAQVLQWLGDVSSNSLRVQQLHQRFAQLHQTLSCDTKALALQALEPWLARMD